MNSNKIDLQWLLTFLLFQGGVKAEDPVYIMNTEIFPMWCDIIMRRRLIGRPDSSVWHRTRRDKMKSDPITG
jgi:hypothetical protein